MVDSVVKSATSKLTFEMIKVSPEVSWFLQMAFQRAEMPGPTGPGQKKTLDYVKWKISIISWILHM